MCTLHLAALFVCATLVVNAQSPSSATLYEGARLIDGNGGPAVDNAAFVVENGRFTQVGRAGQIKAPAGAARVSLAGKTVIPALIDAHVHLADSRDAMLEQLRGKAYWGVGAVMSLGTDPGDVVFKVRDEVIPNAARVRTAGRGITTPEARALGRASLDHDRGASAQGRRRRTLARDVDIIKIWVDDRDGTVQEAEPPSSTSAVIDEAHQRGRTGHRPYLQPRGCERSPARRNRCLCARSARQGRRRRARVPGQGARGRGAGAEHARSRRPHRPRVAERLDTRRGVSRN